MRYRFYTDNKTIVVCVSSYAGKTVRGVAKCDPRDVFDLEHGKALAQARCNHKIAEKRYANAQHKYQEAAYEAEKAYKHLLDMGEYIRDSAIAVEDAKEALFYLINRE